MAAPQQKRIEPPVEPPVADKLTARERAVINVSAMTLQHCRDAALELADFREIVNILTRPRFLVVEETEHPGDTVISGFQNPQTPA